MLLRVPAPSRRHAILLLDLVLLFLFTAVLIRPLFKAKYLDRWDSIESTFIADGRFLHDHWPHPQWQPLWYCGTRFDYIYPPALRYGTAALSRFWIPVKAYHVYTALLYCLGIAGVYFMARAMSGSRGAAWMAAIAAALVSPAFLLISQIRWDAPYHTPWRLWVLLRYGEGPHISSLALLPFALGFAWVGLQRRQTAALACAGFFSALVALTNFYGANALAILYPLVVWSIWVGSRNGRVWLRALVVPALAYGFSAFWLVPSYFRITIENLKWVSVPGNRWSLVVTLAVVAVFLVLSFRLARGKPQRAYAVFLSGSVSLMALMVVGRFWFDFRVLGEPHRLVPELDMLMILAAAELLRRLWNRTWSIRWGAMAARCAVMLILLCTLWSARHYVRRAWAAYLYPPAQDYRQRVEYRMSDWIAEHIPHARSFVTGSNRFWWDTWQDLAQVGGGSEQGLLNQHLPAAQWDLTVGSDPETAVLWLTALGADSLILPRKESQEVFREFHFPDKFTGVLPVLYDDHQGNVIYKVPRRYTSLARVVDQAQLGAMATIPYTSTDAKALRAYTAIVEQGPDVPAITDWDGTDELHIRVRTEAGQTIVVQTSYDPAWRAYVDGKPRAVRRDPMDFMAIDAPPGDHDIALVFETPLENRIGRLLTCLSAVIALAMISGKVKV